MGIREKLIILSEYNVPEIDPSLLGPKTKLDFLPQQLNDGDNNMSKPLKNVDRNEGRELAEALAYNANSLTDLRKAMESFDLCELKKTALQTVFSDGVSNSKIMFIGEAPGAEEDRLGKPFVGQSGQLLDKFLAFANLSREKNVYIANAIPWRPPANRQPTSEETYMCLPFILRHIELIRPAVIGLLGNTAMKAFNPSSDGIVKTRGLISEYTTQNASFNVKMIPLFHPAFLLRSPSQKKFFWKDILSIADTAKNS
jgi:uracil-DNA glycosylase